MSKQSAGSTPIYITNSVTGHPHFLYCSKEGCKQFLHVYPRHKAHIPDEEGRFQKISDEERLEELKCQKRCLPRLPDEGLQEMMNFLSTHEKSCGAVGKVIYL